jgi:hypothetical protein
MAFSNGFFLSVVMRKAYRNRINGKNTAGSLQRVARKNETREKK